MHTYYDLLGVTQGVSPEELKAAYRKLAKACHPDLNANDPQAARRFASLSKAYQVLTDGELRHAYNDHLRRRVRTRRAPWSTIPRSTMLAAFGCATGAGALFFVAMGLWGAASSSVMSAEATSPISAEASAIVTGSNRVAPASSEPAKQSEHAAIEAGPAAAAVAPVRAVPAAAAVDTSAHMPEAARTPGAKNRRASSKRAGTSG
jgi:curved DNA-binding protein CbpA